jgi:hypothetical protein
MSEPTPAPAALAELLDTSPQFDAYFGRKRDDLPELKKKIRQFLRCTMDEARLHTAWSCSHQILSITDSADFEMLREGVSRREASGTISYPGQRDHTAHTLNNWILGWYLYTHSPLLRDSIEQAIKARGWEESRFSHVEFFGHAWQFVSLLHDVGYLFEGAVDALTPVASNDHASIGLRVLDDYFNSHLWFVADFGSAHQQKQLFKDLGFTLPDLSQQRTIPRIARALRELPDLEDITQSIVEACTGLKPANASLCTPTEPLPGDAFDLWRTHFVKFNNQKAADRISAVEKAFDNFAHFGLPKAGVRVLDHGVCSGLILLQASTQYHHLISLLRAKMNSGVSSPAIKRLHEVTTAGQYQYDFVYWWTGIVWATAATAIHNIQQMSKPWFRNAMVGSLPIEAEPLALDEDPLAYLGILADCLQEWDRYFVFASPERLPIQGVDVLLSHDNGKVTIDFETTERAGKVRKDLSAALSEWDKLVTVLPN